MKVEKFEKLYKQEGGMSKLTELRALFYTHEYIADVFKVSPFTIAGWMKDFFGSNYDPRPDRREAVMANMVEFARMHTKENFDFAFRGTEYYREVLSRCKQEGIYDSE